MIELLLKDCARLTARLRAGRPRFQQII